MSQHSPNKKPIVVALTGASGAAYGVRLVEVLVVAGRTVHLAISPTAFEVIAHECGVDRGGDNHSMIGRLWPGLPANAVVYHDADDLSAPISSGSVATDGMAICPCSSSTLAAVALGVGRNLIHRAADVHLKERRRLVLVTRETPLSLPMIRNMAAAAEAGAVILPASPALYHRPQSVAEMIDFVVARVCDQLGVAHGLIAPWNDSRSIAPPKEGLSASASDNVPGDG